MTYEDLLLVHKKYGISEDDILARKGYEEVLKNVVIAPWWSHEIFETKNTKIQKINDKVYNIYGDDFEFSYIELKSVGAPVILDEILTLGISDCENLIFIGSAGSLDDNIKIGDLVIPEYSISGDGASRYLNVNLEDNFGKKVYPDKNLSEMVLQKTMKIAEENNIKYHNASNFSIDTVFAQFVHIDYIKNKGCKTIEMETAAVFKCAEMCNIRASALFCISDNTIVKKSLYSGRTKEENEYRHMVRDEAIPKIIIEVFKNI